jgi:sugar (pentulose or hexulose) kinase
MLRAIYEGVALSMADCLEQLPSFSGAIRLMGGAARSPVWRQMFADATGRPMELVSVSEPGALGVAMQAGVATGMWGSLEEAADTCCHIETVVEPDRAVHGEYIRLLRLYQRLRRDLVEEQELRRELWED